MTHSPAWDQVSHADVVRAIHEAFELGADAVREEDPSGEHRPRVTS